MAVVVTQEGALRIWSQIFGISSIGYPYLHLFSTQHTPAHGDTEATYAAIELVVSGYAPFALTQPPVNWSLAAIGAGAQATYTTVSWTFTAAATVWGYWLADQTNTYSLWAEVFPTSFVYGSQGGVFSLQLVPWLASYPDVGGIPCTSP